MKTFKTFLVPILFVFSCQNYESSKSVEKISYKVTVSQTRSADPINNIDILSDPEAFSPFWKRFRTAVITSDTNQILEMTQFPFKARGPLDDDPTVKFGREKFIPVFYAFLNQWNGLDLELRTELDDIRKTEAIEDKPGQEERARVGNLVFNRNKNEWKLVFIYLNNETIDALQN